MSISNVVKTTVAVAAVAVVGYVGYKGYKAYKKHIGPMVQVSKTLAIIEMKVGKLGRLIDMETDEVKKAQLVERLKEMQAVLVTADTAWKQLIEDYASDQLTHDQWIAAIAKWQADTTSAMLAFAV